VSWGAGVEAVLPANARGDGNVESVSCSSAGNCTAVGQYEAKETNGEGLLLTETAGSWSIGVEAPLPANAATTQQRVALSSVSCSSAGNCGAVGYYRDDTGEEQGLLLTETAGHWSTGVEADLPYIDPNAANRNVELRSSSCSSAGNCSAVGMLIPWGQGLAPAEGVALTETAGTWAPGVKVTSPGGAGEVASFDSVSCGSAGNCVAVGAYGEGFFGHYTGLGSHSLLVTETDGSWGPGAPAPLPPDAAGAAPQVTTLSSVSCASAGNCTAVGIYNGTYYEYPDCDLDCPYALIAEGLLLTETAGSWQAESAGIPSIPDAALDSLASVSCASPGNCSAVGTYNDAVNDIPDEQGLLLTETDGQWATGVKEATPGPYGDIPASVSCASPGNCGAVGGYLLTQTAGAWATGFRPSEPANFKGGGALQSVSCTPDGSCTAVGEYAAADLYDSAGLLIGGASPAVKLDVSTNGTGSGSVSSDVGGIDCGSSCLASFDAGTAVTLTATPSPGSRFTGWSGGACSFNGKCYPVGNCFTTGSCTPDTGISEQTVTATFTRLPWGSAAAVPGASALNVDGSAKVTSISCAGAKACSAGGYYHDGSGYQPFVADESGGSWGNAVKVPGMATLNRGVSASVTSISCATPGNCAAGGYYSDANGGHQAFVVNRTAGVWRNATKVWGSVVLNVGNNARVTSISCAGSGNCAAGGYYSDAKGGRQVFVVNETNGVWGPAITVPGTAVINHGNASVKSISCGSPGNCAAGGTYYAGKSGFQAFLVHERNGVWGTAIEVPGTGDMNVGGNAQVTAVSCPSANSCAAGGTYTDGSGQTQSFILNRRTGASGVWVWDTAIILPGTAAALHVSGFAQLTSISCVDANYCTAAGGYSGPDGNQAFVALSVYAGYWNPATEVPGIASLASTSTAVAISCASVGNCAVTGSDSAWPGVFAAVETNGVWGNAATGDTAPLYGLNALAVRGRGHVTSISCPKRGSTCAIGGSYSGSGAHTQPFVTAAP